MKQNEEPLISIAYVDDDSLAGQTVELHLRDLGCELALFADARKCLAALRESPRDIVITDLQMPGMDGLTLLKEVKKVSPATEVIVVTGHADKHAAIEALKRGAFDFFEKPVDREELVETVKKTMRYRTALRERDRFREQLSFVTRQEAKRWGIDAFVGKSKVVQKILWDVRLLQRSANTSVLITGESGTGKELVARAIHFGGSRATRPFVPVNCSAVPTELAESMLFGHVKGSFTGATSDKKGCFETAHEGTVFLDEIGDMPAAVQIKLLRVLEDGVVVPVGGTTGRRVDVRIIAATNADLKARMASGAFRSDLFYRLAGFMLTLPPLRERADDIPLLARHFAETLSSEMGLRCPRIGADAMQALRRHGFPGNVRELRNMIERAIIETAGEEIAAAHLHFLELPRAMPAGQGAERTVPPDQQGNLPLNLREAERAIILRALREADGNMAAAARLLGINRTKLYRKIAALEPGFRPHTP